MSRISRLIRKWQTSLVATAKREGLRDKAPEVTKFEKPVWRPEAFEDQIYKAVVEPGNVVYDVGANAGQLAEILAYLTGHQGSIYAFEPVWPTYLKLCERVSSRSLPGGTIYSFPIGMSNRNGEITIEMPEGHDGLATAAAPNAWNALSVLDGLKRNQYLCQIRRMDDFARDANLPAPHVLKIDVEGGELLVVEGSLETIRHAQPVLVMEVFAPWQAGFGYGPWQLFQILNDLGYEINFACPEGLVSHRPTQDQPMPRAYENGYNIVAVHPEKHTSVKQRLERLKAGSPEVLPMPPAPLPNVA
ncbi:FkbM family methyltransferase [Bremerella sp. T1]|uniref:FkbM family methyltransferase n=1 Tax=Bremerella sp. TYQ1 TaxID=3119568 RepID=UPI001CCADCA3|nr:FkbM family methyltransferase [Bremerella volcania]UBM35425.1 FkbM family methyltransferase [Bremerella volcania]